MCKIGRFLFCYKICIKLCFLYRSIMYYLSKNSACYENELQNKCYNAASNIMLPLSHLCGQEGSPGSGVRDDSPTNPSHPCRSLQTQWGLPTAPASLGGSAWSGHPGPLRRGGSHAPWTAGSFPGNGGTRPFVLGKEVWPCPEAAV